MNFGGRGDSCLLSHQFDGLVDASEFVYQAVGFGLIAHPDAALGEGFDACEGLLTGVGNLLDKVDVAGVDAFAEFGSVVRGQRLVFGFQHRVPATGDEVLGDADFVIEPLDRWFGHDDSDGAGLSAGVGNDGVAGHGHVVTAGGCGVGHGDHHGLFLAELVHGGPHLIGGGNFATG